MAVEFADVEVALVAYLKGRMAARGDAAKVATKRTTSSPARLVRLTRVGGTVENLVSDVAMVAFECWDVDDDGAADLARIVRAEVQALDTDSVSATAGRHCVAAGVSMMPPPSFVGKQRFVCSSQT